VTVKPSRLFFALIAAIVLIHAAAASAGSIDMDDPRRTVGREDDIRIDAQLIQDTVSPGSAIGVTWQIENLGTTPVAVADRIAAATYDADTNTITFSIGSEVPHDGKMPHMITIAAGEKKLFRAGATPLLGGAERTALSQPRFVQVKVTVMRDLAPFEKLINAQAQAAQQRRGDERSQPLPDDLFEKWFEANDTIFLNAVPVRFSPRHNMHGFASAEQRGSADGM
jgi:hypothetical protein